MVEIFKYYPKLEANLRYISLGEFPTPIKKLPTLGKELGINNLYLKQDNLSGKSYGGNKVRKLEFILGDILCAGKKEILTFGAAGSNHALATAVYAQRLGLKCISILLPQPITSYTRRNLLMSYKVGTELHFIHYGKLGSSTSRLIVFLAKNYQLLRHRLKTGQFPKIIPVGGTSPLGVLGYVNAAFEIKDQIIRGEIPEPDFVYVAMGTMGTSAGLTIGFKAAGLKTKVISVRVTGKTMVNVDLMLRLIRQVQSLLNSKDSSFPKLEFKTDDIDIRDEFYGQQYALFTKEGMEAVVKMKECEGIKLDGTYTGKAFAAIMHDARNGGLKDKVVLFLNTLNSRDFSDIISTVDYHSLPSSLHRYFEESVQPLDIELKI